MRLQIKTGIPRPVEAFLAAAALLAVSPCLALSALLIAITSRGPVFFRHKRVGWNGRVFILFKLRTMRLEHRGLQITAGGDARVTFVGKLLRKTKVDELPQLWNVLKGDMSLVGPRPEVQRYVDLQDARWRYVLAVRPGITDPITLRLRNEEDLLARVHEDRELFYRNILQPYKLNGYVEFLRERNWWSDVKVLFMTSFAVAFPHTTPTPPIEEIITCANGGSHRA